MSTSWNTLIIDGKCKVFAQGCQWRNFVSGMTNGVDYLVKLLEYFYWDLGMPVTTCFGEQKAEKKQSDSQPW